MTSVRQRTRVGQRGEDQALDYLQARGYHLVARNWQRPSGEIDLVMSDQEMLVFVEVKARRSETAGRADDAVSPSKAARLLTTAEWFLAEHPEHQHRIWRVDLLAIAIDDHTGAATIRHYPNAIVGG